MTKSEVSEKLLSIPENAVLLTKNEVAKAIQLSNSLRLPLHIDPPKNWDSLAALAIISRYVPNMNSQILDAGGEKYSVILKQLKTIGFQNLTCINLVYTASQIIDGIKFAPGDITKTEYPDDYFDAIVCLSVIEHGVDIAKYFKEASRILKPGGILFTSFDYWPTHVDTMGKFAYGVPIKVFDKNDLLLMLKIAAENKLNIRGRLRCSRVAAVYH